MKRRKGNGELREIMEMEVPGTRPRGRPKKTWTKNIEEDIYLLNLMEGDVYDRIRW